MMLILFSYFLFYLKDNTDAFSGTILCENSGSSSEIDSPKAVVKQKSDCNDSDPKKLFGTSDSNIIEVLCYLRSFELPILESSTQEQLSPCGQLSQGEMDVPLSVELFAHTLNEKQICSTSNSECIHKLVPNTNGGTKLDVDQPVSSTSSGTTLDFKDNQLPHNMEQFSVREVQKCKKKSTEWTDDKRAFCIYCYQNVTSFPRHLKREDSGETAIRQFLKLPSHSVKRNNEINVIRKESNFVVHPQKERDPASLVPGQFCESEQCISEKKKDEFTRGAQTNEWRRTDSTELKNENLPSTENTNCKTDSTSQEKKTKIVRERWTSEQRNTTLKYFNKHIQNKKCPTEKEISTFKSEYKFMETKDWKKIKAFVFNAHFETDSTLQKKKEKIIRKRWTSEQRNTTLKYFSKHIQNQKCPTEKEIATFKSKYEFMETKDWKKIKAFVFNAYYKK